MITRQRPLAAAAGMCAAMLGAVTLGGAALAAQAAPPPPPADASSLRHIFGLRTALRDGVELSSDVWLPKSPGPHPVILIRTPYVKALGSFNADAAFFARHGYAVVVQDVRGRGDSGGEFDFFFQEGKDGYDTVEAIAGQPWSNGRVCMLGVSYMATVQWLAARERPPHLTCMASVSPAARFMNEIPAVGGAFGAQWGLTWLNATSDHGLQARNTADVDWARVLSHRPLRTADEAMGRKMRLYREFLENDTLNAYWQRLYLQPGDYAQIKVPILQITGLFDADQSGALLNWTKVEANAPQQAGERFLVIGPWTHDQSLAGGADPVGELTFPQDTASDNRALALRFFDHYLKQDGKPFEQPRVRVFMTGANEWRTFDRYPQAGTKEAKLFLDSRGAANTLSGDGVLTRAAARRAGKDHYVFNPRDPIVQPTGASTSDIGQGADRRVIQSRKDVLVYTGPVLDKPVDVVGSVWLDLYAASDALDTDFTASLTDVGPDGRAVSLGPLPFGVLRARYRNGLESAELLTPGKPELFKIELGHVAHRFKAGHRIRLEISSSAYPVINPNQNTGAKVADDTEWRIARQTVHHGIARPSALRLPVLAP